MAKVMIFCTRTGKPLDTGLDLPLGTSLKGYAKHRVSCPHCKGEHGVRRPYFESEGPGEIGRYSVALDCEPIFAAEVGVLLSCFALVEGYMPKIMSKLTGISENDSATIVGSFTNFSSKIELIDALSKNRDSNLDKEAIDKLFTKIREANSLRNIYAHSQYSITFHDDFVINSFLHDTKKKSKKQTKSLDDIVEDVNSLKRTIHVIHGYIHRNEKPQS